MEKNYVAKLLKALVKDKMFLSKKQEKFLIGLSDNDIKKVKKYCIDEGLIEQKNKEFVLTKKGRDFINGFQDRLESINLEYLKAEKTPPVLTKAIRLYAKHLLEDTDLKENSLESKLKEEFKHFDRNIYKEASNLLLQDKQINLEQFFNYFLSKGLTKSIISILLLEILAKNIDKIAIYEKGQFELNFNQLMLDRIIVNPSNFEIRNTVLESSFLNKKINILEETKKLILKFKSLEKITLQTTKLNPATLKFKNIVLNAKDPMQLFSRDLENIFKTEDEFLEAIKELENFYSNTVHELKKFIFEVFSIKCLGELKARFEKIKDYINNKELLILGNNLSSIERFATYINQKRVPKDWSDLDIANFKLKTKELSNLFLTIETTVDSSGSRIDITTQNLIDEILKLNQAQKNILLRKVV